MHGALSFTGQKETEIDMIRYILAQLELTYLVRDCDANGIPFRSHLHCPEVHPDTGTFFCEREDAGHVLKVVYIYMKVLIKIT